MLIIDEVRLPACSDVSLRERISEIIGLPREELKEIKVLRKSLDARKKRGVAFVFRVAVSLSSEEEERRREGGRVRFVESLPRRWSVPELPISIPDRPIVIVGAGPAGLFAAWVLATRGVPVLLLEKGKRLEERVRDLSDFWRKGLLRTESNVQFGEGGAGCFSDGKLTTRIRGRELELVLDVFSRLTGDPELAVSAKPHVGTNRLRRFILNMRKEILSSGGEILFGSEVIDLKVEGDRVVAVLLKGGGAVEGSFFVFAPGHSSREVYGFLSRRGVTLEAKPFAVGVRVEHPQWLIDEIQYGDIAGCGCLPPADYRISVRTRRGVDLYSFCMCPGGMVLLCSSEGEDVVVNGMSPTGRKTGFANSGFVFQVFPRDAGRGWEDGIEFQRQLERRAFELAGGEYLLPAMRLTDFIEGREPSGELPPGRWAAPGRVPVDLGKVFPQEMREILLEGLKRVGKVMKGFITREATVYGVESRTSSPVRIVRGKGLHSPSYNNFFPAGEGAGYAGGISSSAVDGVRVAVGILNRLSR